MYYKSLLKTGKVIVAGILCSMSQLAAQNSTIELDVGKATYTIKKEVYGALMENWTRDIYNGVYVGEGSTVPNANGIRKDVIAAFKEAEITCLDWPGGCFAENYQWKNGIGPKESRPGGDCSSGTNSNGFGTHEYFEFCDSVESIPYVTANLSTADVQNMVDWLKYIDENFSGKLVYWKMGNEPWGGCKAQGIPGISVDQYIGNYKKYEAAIPDDIREKIFRIADGGSGNGLSFDWLDELMRTTMDKMEGATFHYYSGFSGDPINFSVSDYYGRLQSAWLMNFHMDKCEQIMNKYDPDCTIGLMVDEWGTWYSNAQGKDHPQSTCRDAVIASMNLNIFNNRCRRVWMASVAQPVNVIQALIFTENPARDRIVKTPTFYVFKMYKVHQDANMVPVELTTRQNQNVPLITASASVDSTGTLHISMCNTLYSTAETVEITLKDAPEYNRCTGTIVTGPEVNSYNDFGKPEQVNIQDFDDATLNGNSVTVSIPAHSVVTLELEAPTGTIAPKNVSEHFPGWSVEPCASGALLVRSFMPEVHRIAVKLFDSKGQAVMASERVTVKSSSGFVWRKPQHPLSAGIYFLTIRDESRVVTKSVVIR